MSLRAPGIAVGLLLAALGASCASDGVEAMELGGSLATGRCGEPPVAYVLEGPDGRAGDLLSEAGFEVQALPATQSPAQLKGLVWLGSYASDTPAYTTYMQRFSADLYHFVDRGNVLVQMAQSGETEESPPFLPSTHGAKRREGGVELIYVVTPDNPLLEGASIRDGVLDTDGVETLTKGRFYQQGGFEILLAADDVGLKPVLMEGAYGQGRLLLSSFSFDTGAGPEVPELSSALLDNLLEHTSAVCRRMAPALGVTDVSDDLVVEGDSFTLAVLPDTQIYSLRFPGLFTAQTAWLTTQVEALNIAYVLHLGDIVNNNTDLEWQRASAAMAELHGVVPYALVPGNHDYGPSGDASTRQTKLNQYFDYEISAGMPSFGGAYVDGELDNTYHLFTAGGRDFIIIALEWGPRDEVIEWANTVMEEHPGRLGIFITHAYLNHNDRRYDHTDTEHPQDYNPHEYATPGGVNDGEELWQELIRHHDFVLTINGHVIGDGTGYLASVNDRGRTVHQMLVNYQMRELGGEGYLRLLTFQDGARNVSVYSYTPLYDLYLTQADQQFTFELDVD